MSPSAQWRFWTVPNLLSLSRLAFLPLWWILMRSPDRSLWLWGGVLIVYGMASDVLDGYIARRCGQSTELGRILDPVGDKIAAAVIAIFCLVHRGLPALALILTMGRDLLLVVAGWLIYRRVRHIPPSIDLGRYAALLWAVVLLLYAFDIQPYGGWLLWPVVGLYLLAGGAYVVRRRHVLTGGRPEI